MLNQFKQDAKNKMEKSIQALKAALAKLRTGRANTSLLENIKVSYYGNLTPLNQVASVSVADARTLVVAPWEKNVIPDIEKAIMNADLGLNPVTAGMSIRVPLPPLNEERRRELGKVVRQEGENAKVAVRNIRRDANTHSKDLLKDKKITEDESRRFEDEMQKLTDHYIKEIDKIISAKENELLEV